MRSLCEAPALVLVILGVLSASGCRSGGLEGTLQDRVYVAPSKRWSASLPGDEVFLFGSVTDRATTRDSVSCEELAFSREILGRRGQLYVYVLAWDDAATVAPSSGDPHGVLSAHGWEPRESEVIHRQEGLRIGGVPAVLEVGLDHWSGKTPLFVHLYLDHAAEAGLRFAICLSGHVLPAPNSYRIPETMTFSLASSWSTMWEFVEGLHVQPRPARTVQE